MIRAALIACTICLGNADSPLLDAARVGVVVMVAVTACVLGVFGRWFVKLAARQSSESEGTE